MRRVLHLLDKPFPPDIRFEKEARTLSAAGYEVHLLCRSIRPGAAVPSVRVHALPPRRKAPFLGGRDLRYLLTFVDGAWSRGIRRLAAELRPAIFHVHDLPLAPTVLDAGGALGIPVLVDFRENWPAALRVWRAGSSARGFERLRGRAVAAVHECGPRYRRAEVAVSRRAAAVLAVVAENRDRLVAAGAPADRVVVVENAVDPEELSGETGGFVPPVSPYLLVYAGDLALFRGVQDVIAAMPHVLARAPEARLLVMGDGVARAALEGEARRRGVASAVQFTGWLPGGAVGAAVRAAAVGVVPHRKNEHTDTTMPNKIYQYLWAGLPAVTSDAAPMARLVRECGCGIVARSGEPASYAEALVRLADPGERERFASRAAAAAKTWDGEAAVLLDVYRRLAPEA